MTPMQPDDNLVNGNVYTFQFQNENYFLAASNDTLTADIVAQAPTFVTAVQVLTPSISFTLGDTSFYKTLYNVQFTYEGDNTDVVQDVAASIVAAVLSVSGDKVSFVGAIASSGNSLVATPAAIGTTAVQTATGAATAVLTGVGQVGTTATQQAGGIVNSALSGILPVLIVLVLLVMFVLPSLAKSTGEIRG
jgi:hypothetical protein